MKALRFGAVFFCLTSFLRGHLVEMRNGERHSMTTVSVSGGVMQGRTAAHMDVHLKVSEIVRVLEVRPKELFQAETLLAAGKAQEALPLLDAFLDRETPWRGIPGTRWTEVAGIRLEALSLMGDATKLEAVLSEWEKSPEAAEARNLIDFGRFRLAALKGDQAGMATLGAKLLSSQDPVVEVAAVERILADSALHGKRLMEAMEGYRRILVMTGKARRHHAAAELGLVRCLIKMGAEAEARKRWERLRSEHPDFFLKNQDEQELRFLLERGSTPKTNPVLRLPPQ